MYFFRKYKNRMIVALVAIILIIIIGYTSKDRPNTSKADKILGSVLDPVKKVSQQIGGALSPVKKAGYKLGHKISSSFDFVFNFTSLSVDNEKLKEEVIKLREENKKLENIVGKSDFLKAEAEIYRSSPHKLLGAQVTGKDPGNWFDNFTIDKGSKDGVQVGATIVQGIETDEGVFLEGLVGRVVEVGPNYSKVTSVIDEVNKVAFHSIRSQDGGILSGTTDYSINGYLYDSKADIVEGDDLYTSGLGKVFVKDIYIGKVKEVIEAEEEMSKKIVVEPAINFKKIYKVFVISEDKRD